MMRRATWLVLAGGLLLCALPPRPQAQEAASLSWELSQLMEVWLHGDDAGARARLQSFQNDNRLRGELPRWVDALSACMALEAGDAKAALTALEPGLKAADNPRPFLRAARILLAWGETGHALAVIRQGRARDPYNSAALRRFEAGLLWLGGDAPAAQQAYIAMIADDARDEYPFIAPQAGDWAMVRPWGGPEKPPPGMVRGGSRWDYEESEPEQAWRPEPFLDLFERESWHPDDLPGLSRMISEMAASPDALARQRAAFPGVHKRAGEAQRAFESFRGGDADERNRLRRQAVLLRWETLVAARTCALADIAAGRSADAETMLRMALELSQTDTALLDLLARALGAQGKAEEARTGPLSQLSLQGLAVTGYWPGPQLQMADLVLDPALNLLKTNAEAGKQQLAALRDQFGPEHTQRRISADAIGVWLLQRGQPELALEYLREGARQSGYESGKPLSAGAIVLESALLALQAPVGAAEPGAQPEGAPASMMGALPRAGLLLASVMDSRMAIYRATEVSVSSTSFGSMNHTRAARLLPEGDKRLRELLFGYHAKLATEAKAEEIDALLKPDSPESTRLAEALKTLDEAVRQVKDNSNWRAHDTIRQKLGFIMGQVETRALLLRARLRQQPPKDMAALAAWLAQHQGPIDLRVHLHAAPSDATAKAAQELAAAKVPEVVHSGLLLDAAKIIARAGDAAGAAKLLWLNRDAPLGVDSRARRLFVAAALAGKAGDKLLQAQCRLAALEGADPSRNRGDVGLRVLELPQLRSELEEFGAKADLADFVDACIASYADSALLAAAFKAVPELRAERPSMLMRNTMRDGTDNVFRATIEQGSVSVIDQNWLKMLSAPEYHGKCRRMALWVIASDLPFAFGRGGGIGSAADAVRAWSMMQQLHEARAGADPAAKAASERLKKLIQRCGMAPEEDTVGYEYDWWD